MRISRKTKRLLALLDSTVKPITVFSICSRLNEDKKTTCGTINNSFNRGELKREKNLDGRYEYKLSAYGHELVVSGFKESNIIKQDIRDETLILFHTLMVTRIESIYC